MKMGAGGAFEGMVELETLPPRITHMAGKLFLVLVSLPSCGPFQKAVCEFSSTADGFPQGK